MVPFLIPPLNLPENDGSLYPQIWIIKQCICTFILCVNVHSKTCVHHVRRSHSLSSGGYSAGSETRQNKQSAHAPLRSVWRHGVQVIPVGCLLLTRCTEASTFLREIRSAFPRGLRATCPTVPPTLLFQFSLEDGLNPNEIGFSIISSQYHSMATLSILLAGMLLCEGFFCSI